MAELPKEYFGSSAFLFPLLTEGYPEIFLLG
jgi:hypothetical protein